jgi:hypothetical protein
MSRKAVPGTLDWRKLYAASRPKNAEEQALIVRDCHSKGIGIPHIALIAHLSVNEVKSILGVLV